jgi:Flp pilus assembly protein TadD
MFPNADIQLSKTLQQKGVDSCIAQYKQMKKIYPDGAMTEGTLNKLGYYLLGRGDFQGAIKLFSLNVTMYPKSFNTYDSLADAYEKAGNNKEAINNYVNSLELNAQNKNAVARLSKLTTLK